LYIVVCTSSTAIGYYSGTAKQKSHQKMMIFDFDTKYFHPNSISSKYGDHHFIPREILRRSLTLTFHLKPIIKQISLIEQKCIKPSLFDGVATPQKDTKVS
jgi:hypothetical protein